MCVKVKLSKKEATIALKTFPRVGKQYRKEKRIYYCDHCNAWHLTSHDNMEKTEPLKLTLPKKWHQILKRK